MGEYSRAIEYYKKALKIDLKIFGNQHPDIATRYNNIAEALKGNGEYNKAAEYHEKALKIFRKVYPNGHE